MIYNDLQEMFICVKIKFFINCLVIIIYRFIYVISIKDINIYLYFKAKNICYIDVFPFFLKFLKSMLLEALLLTIFWLLVFCFEINHF